MGKRKKNDKDEREERDRRKHKKSSGKEKGERNKSTPKKGARKNAACQLDTITPVPGFGDSIEDNETDNEMIRFNDRENEVEISVSRREERELVGDITSEDSSDGEVIDSANNDEEDDAEITFNRSNRAENENSNATSAVQRGDRSRDDANVVTRQPVEVMTRQCDRGPLLPEAADVNKQVGNSKKNEKEQWIGEAIGRLTSTMVELFEKGGFVRKENPENSKKGKGKGKNRLQPDDNQRNRGTEFQSNNLDEVNLANMAHNNESETTIYKRAVKMEEIAENVPHEEPKNNSVQKRISSSSEEIVDTSDELIELNEENRNKTSPQVPERNIDEMLNRARLESQLMNNAPANNNIHFDEIVGTSNDRRRNNIRSVVVPAPLVQPQPHCSYQNQQSGAERRADDIIRQAESSKAKMFDVPGMPFMQAANVTPPEQDSQNNTMPSGGMLHSVMVDESYSMVASHVDPLIRARILEGEYVDFAKLLPKDKINWHDDNQMEMMFKEGRTYFVPASDRENVVINSFSKWEQAFRIFCNIYTERYPEKAVELTQYAHVIFSAALSFTWSNVYAYDKDFRLHLSRFNNQRSWGIILQQAWSIRLRDRIGDHRSIGGATWNGDASAAAGSPANNNNNGRNRRDVCWRFNRGHCNFGQSCRFEHKCALCLKFGHGSHNCRKADRQ